MPLKKSTTSVQLEQPWNTARCHRLIRPLVAAIQTFRSDVSNDGQVSMPQTNQSGQHTGNKNPHFKTEQDPDWSIALPRRRLKRTYSDRSASAPIRKTIEKESSHFSQGSQPGEIVVPTPILKRIRTGNSTQPEDAKGSHTLSGQQEQGIHDADIYRTNTPTSTFERVLMAFERIFAATEMSTMSKPPSVGARSLFSLCLQAVPNVMAEEERVRLETDPDDNRDVSAEIYAELEGLEPLPGYGWKHLSEVVRAHAVLLLLRVIEELQLDVIRIKSLLRVCSRYNASAEADKLLAAFLSPPRLISDGCGSTYCGCDSKASMLYRDCHIEYKRCRSCGPTCATQGRFNEQIRGAKPLSDASFLSMMFRDVYIGQGARIRHIARMIGSGRLSPAVLAEPSWRNLWSDILQSISTGNQGAAQAATFVVQILSSACGLCTLATEEITQLKSSREAQQHANENTVISLLAILVSIANVTQDTLNGSNPSPAVQRLLWPLHALSSMLLRQHRRERDHGEAFSSQHVAPRLVVLAAEVLVSVQHSNPTPEEPSRDLEDNLERLSIVRDAAVAANGVGSHECHGISSLICAVARCTGKAQAIEPFRIFQTMVEKLLSFQSTKTSSRIKSPGRSMLLGRQLALSGALAFAQQSDDAEHLAFAYQLEKSAGQALTCTHHNTIITKPISSPALKKRFRWEEI